nr:hypothetical protein Iba_chr02cCG15360 [Ipomoea batatas]
MASSLGAKTVHENIGHFVVTAELEERLHEVLHLALAVKFRSWLRRHCFVDWEMRWWRGRRGRPLWYYRGFALQCSRVNFRGAFGFHGGESHQDRVGANLIRFPESAHQGKEKNDGGCDQLLLRRHFEEAKCMSSWKYAEDMLLFWL